MFMEQSWKGFEAQIISDHWVAVSGQGIVRLSDFVLTIGTIFGVVVVAQLVASREPQFKSSHWQKFILNIYCNEKTKIKKKRPRLAHFLKNLVEQFEVEFNGQSYKCSTIVNYDARVLLIVPRVVIYNCRLTTACLMNFN